MKILFVTSEMVPLASTGGLGDVAGSLPEALRGRGLDVRVVMPLYKTIKQSYASELQFLRWSIIRLGWRTMYSGLFSMEVNGVPIYLIDNDFYFGHDNLYIDYSFDVERFSFFQRAVLEALGEPMGFEPDLIHLNDWQTAM
ncbi:MAG: glycogen/starch synthase, partial [Clostridiaceae bacterium]|nr:glycogen/starch synthase [Clostridiaceae bacterium]